MDCRAVAPLHRRAGGFSIIEWFFARNTTSNANPYALLTTQKIAIGSHFAFFVCVDSPADTIQSSGLYTSFRTRAIFLDFDVGVLLLFSIFFLQFSAF